MSFLPQQELDPFWVPPAIVVQAEVFDEQALKREWDDAVADEHDAYARKVEVLKQALKKWPMIPNPKFPGKFRYHPEMRRFVRDVLGLPDNPNGGMNVHAGELCKLNSADEYREKKKAQAHRRGTAKIKNAAVEIVDSYLLGADPKQCMEALAKFIKETREQTTLS